MGGFGKSESSSQSRQFSESFVDPAQAPFLANLRNAAQTLAFQQLGPIQEAARGFSSQLGNVGGGLLAGLTNQAGGLGPGVGQSILEQLQFRPGGGAGDALIQGAAGSAQELLGPNPGLQPQLDALQQAVQSNLQATAGTIAGQASLAGGLGGSRQALATGLAGQEAQRQFGQGAADLFAQDFATRQQLAPQLVAQQLQAGSLLNQQGLAQSGQALQALQGAGQLGLGTQEAQTAAGLGGLGQLGTLFNLGMAPFSAAFSPLMSLAQIIGRPTVLQRGEGTSSGGSESFSFSF